MLQAIYTNNVPLVRSLHPHSTVCDHSSKLVEAISAEAWDVVYFLLAHCTAKVSLDAPKQAIHRGHLDVAAHLLQCHPRLRSAALLDMTTTYHYTDATRFLLDTGFCYPRECLKGIAGCRQYATESKLLLEYCMYGTDHLGNILFLWTFSRSPTAVETMLQLITPELLKQGQMASETIQLVPSVAARASSLLQSREVVDWALALVICYFTTSGVPGSAKELAT